MIRVYGFSVEQNLWVALPDARNVLCFELYHLIIRLVLMMREYTMKTTNCR